jgi:hypothetical protein
MTSDTQRRAGFRIPCEFQIRFRKIQDDELDVFTAYAMRPSPYSHLRNEIQSQLAAMDIRHESKALLEKAFQILLNIDQRIERIEERLDAKEDEGTKIFESYQWVHGHLGAGGLTFQPEGPKTAEVGEKILMDLLLPSMPEQRIVSAGQIIRKEQDGVLVIEFVAIHQEDEEFLFQFVASKEREMLRARALERDKK